MKKKNKAIFLDRDGILNKVIIRRGKPSSPWNLKDFKLLSHIEKYLKTLNEIGFLNIVFTNQPDVKRGYLKVEDLEKMHKIIAEKLPVDEITFCPHDDKDNCSCRKPTPGLIFEAAKKWSLDLKNSFVIGDNWKDVLAGKKAGCKTILIRRNYNKNLKDSYNFEARNLKEAVEIIKKIKSD